MRCKIMRELIKITAREDGSNLVSAKELYDFLEIATPFHKWIVRMIDYGFQENLDYLVEDIFVPNSKGGKQTQKDYIITTDMAKELSMIQRTDKGKEARKYFIQCEKKLKEQNKLSLPTTYKEALLALVEAEEEKEKLLLENIEMKPKAEYHDIVLNAENLLTVTEISKDLGMSAVKLNKLLNEKKVQFKKNGTWHLYSKYQNMVNDGYCDYKITEHGESLKWTEKGRKWIIDILGLKSIVSEV